MPIFTDVLWEDLFNDGAGNIDGVNGWDAISGVAYDGAGNVVTPYNFGHDALQTTEWTDTDYGVEVIATVGGGASTWTIGAIMRGDSTLGGGNNVRAELYEDGTIILWDDTGVADFATGQTTTGTISVAIECVGTLAKAYVNGVEVCSVTTAVTGATDNHFGMVLKDTAGPGEILYRSIQLLGDAPVTPIASTDIVFHLSASSGPGLANAQGNVNNSLGGFIASTAATTAVVHNLFDRVSGDDNAGEIVDYRCLFVRNIHATDSLENVVVFINSQVAGGASAAIGVDPTGVVAEDSASAQAVTIANETTAPAGVTFSAPTSAGDGLAIGTLGPGEVQAIWIRRTAQDSGPLDGDGLSLRIFGTV